ncbi:HBL/NHE enterotoxin family protein [Brevibacillus laterosporus]|uniref:HBL/NHE enterotoxin family protein n=1 Tax=Brevibacillus laterosporus TaxID=1465 RepID=UPI0026507257|nr:HBL/NHE enterotoxin family protein [Brevibacillus laterosporus]MDN9011210.1 HBL/NHE enterotoxin family protein [Brevibacillus laterosporus]MDO0942233.1 HBL/NHE enterotoxin family protein [Brevibacillus laterosporus]
MSTLLSPTDQMVGSFKNVRTTMETADRVTMTIIETVLKVYALQDPAIITKHYDQAREHAENWLGTYREITSAMLQAVRGFGEFFDASVDDIKDDPTNSVIIAEVDLEELQKQTLDQKNRIDDLSNKLKEYSLDVASDSRNFLSDIGPIQSQIKADEEDLQLLQQ